MCTGGSQKRIDGPHSVKYSRGGTAHAERGSQPEDRSVKVLGAEIDFPTLLAAGVPYLVDTAPAIRGV